MALQRENSCSSRTLQRGKSFTERLQQVPINLLQRCQSIRVEELSLTTWEVSGVQRRLADDFSHMCLEMEWSRLGAMILAVYLATSLTFAVVLYCSDGALDLGGDLPPTMSAFEICLWFATVNVVTAGFGSLVPMSTSAYIISTAAHLTGLLLNALLLGVVVAKASLPSAKMVFSNVICVRMRNGIQQLMVRVGNARGNILYSPDIRFAYIHSVTTTEGETFFEDLMLHVHVPAALKPAFTITHPVTQDSPLDGKSEQDIVKEKGFFVLIVSATDVETGQSLYARRLFFMKDFRFNHAFVDVISEREDSTPPEQSTPAEAVEGFIRQTKIIDFLKFHDTAKLDAKCWREGAEVCEPTRRFGILASANVRSEPATPPSASRRRPKPIGQFEVDGFSDSEEYGYCAADAWEKRKEPRRSLGQDKRAIMQRSCSEGLIGEWTGADGWEFTDEVGHLSSGRSLRSRHQIAQKEPH